MAVRFSKNLRDAIQPMTLVANDRGLMYRLNTALYKWIRESKSDNDLPAENISLLNGLELNEQVRPSRRIKFDPLVSFDEPGKIRVTIPALKPSTEIVCPEKTSKIQLVIMAARCNTEPAQTGSFTNHAKKEIVMDYTPAYEEQHVELLLNTYPKDILIVAIGLNFFLRDGYSENPSFDKNWLPGKIIASAFKNE